MAIQPVLIAGQWRPANASETFQAFDPKTQQPLSERYPVSSWQDCEQALASAASAYETMRGMSGEQIAGFLEAYAVEIESRAGELVELANRETGLPASPRLADVELPRTTSQMRQAASAARDGGWTTPIIDSKLNIRSCFGPLGPVCVFGPNNFPFAFNSISGGDFVAAVAAGNPVIAKANSSHPGTTRVFAEAAQEAAESTGMPAGTVQLLYRTSHQDGQRLVADPRVGATGYTGSRSAGLKLKAAADAAGKPIYLELSSVNPVAILPGALRERLDDLVGEFTASCLMGTGQFCTNPGLVLLLKSSETETFVSKVAESFQSAPVGTLLSSGVKESLRAGLKRLVETGAEVLAGNTPAEAAGFCYANTLLLADGERFLAQPEAMQTEAFGNSSLLVVASDIQQACRIVDHFEGNLTGCIYSDTAGSDDQLYDQLAARLRDRVGRLLNDKMPTGVAVSSAMNHGGPFPATGHPGYTAVGLPTAIHRFAMLQCYDNVRPHRLPPALQDANPSGTLWRQIDGQWSQADVPQGG